MKKEQHVCDDCEELFAISYCKECDLNLCKDCSDLHCHCDGCKCVEDLVDIKEREVKEVKKLIKKEKARK